MNGDTATEPISSRTWIFQSNPDRYDIDRALEELDEIQWRVPQYTYHIHPGDDVVIWRSGDEAGIVGIGKILTSPTVTTPNPKESTYYPEGLDADDPEQCRATRVNLRVRPVEHVPKEAVLEMAPLRDHRIIMASWGTVFPLSGDQWKALVHRHPEMEGLTDLEVTADTPTTPPVFSWDDRLKSVYPLPGGYEAYLDTLRTVLERVDEVRPDRPDLEQWIQERFGINSNSARFQLNFLERVSLLSVDANRVDLSPEGRLWLSDPDPACLIALMHSRIRLIGELLSLLDEPRTSDELLELANDYYDMGWKSKAQIERRRGWLESAGVVEADDQGRLFLTGFGEELLGLLDVHPPIEAGGEPDPEEEPGAGEDEEEDGEETSLGGAETRLVTAERLHRQLKETSHDSAAPDEFERVAADAFAFLGFASSWLGGSGKTDVLLVAELGPDEGYRVIVDCKTTGSGGIPDQQIDWVTLDDHQGTHNADFVVLLGPQFQGTRVRERAEKKDVSLIDVNTLGGLLRQHARIPLGLDAYRHLFEETEATDATALVAELGEEEDRRIRLAADIVRLIAENEGKEGPLGARDLYWLLQHASEEPGDYEEEEIAQIVEALAAPGLGILRSVGANFLTLGSRATVAARLELLASLILEHEEQH